MSTTGRRTGSPASLSQAGAACAALVAYARWGLLLLLAWGATVEEVFRAYHGDEFIPDADGRVFTMAATLPAPPEKVWPWLVQMGGDRAGFFAAGTGWTTAASLARTASCQGGRP